MARPRASTGPGSRARLLTAATREFAAHGLAGASVDRIARRARLNKAMVYYHFKNKEALYREIIASTFAAVGSQVSAIRASAADPREKLVAFVGAFVEEALGRPDFPRMVMREMSESGSHLNLETAREWVRVHEAFFGILQEGLDRAVFRPVHPLFGFLTTVAPVILLLAGAPARKRASRLLGRALPEIDLRQLSRQAQAAALAVFTAVPAPSSTRANGVTHAPRLLPASNVARTPAVGRPGRRRGVS